MGSVGTPASSLGKWGQAEIQSCMYIPAGPRVAGLAGWLVGSITYHSQEVWWGVQTELYIPSGFKSVVLCVAARDLL